MAVKKRKGVLAVLIAFSLFCAVSAVSAFAAERAGIAVGGNYHFDAASDLLFQYIEYTVTDQGEIAITGYRDNEVIRVLDIPRYHKGYPVTEINPGVFKGKNHLTEVKLPSTLKTLGKEAFQSCKFIAKVTIAEGLTVIGKGAFAYCDRLEYTEIPESLTVIDDEAFSDCIGLKGINVPQGVRLPSRLTRIGTGAFNFCEQLTGTVKIPDGIREIEARAFTRCQGIERFILPEKLTVIRSAAFVDCNAMQSISIPAFVAAIEDDAFGACSRLIRVELFGKTPPQLGKDVFRDLLTDLRIYVPQTSLAAYQIAWSVYSNLLIGA